MEKMPYQDAASADAVVSAVPPPGVARPATNDWRSGLPTLTGSLVTLRELRAERRAVAVRRADDRRGHAVHLAAAGDGRGVRAVHRVDAPAARGRPVRLLRGRAARLRHRDRPVPGALARAGVRHRRVGLRDRVGVLGHRRLRRRRAAGDRRSRSTTLGAHRLEARAALANGRGNGRCASWARCAKAILRKSFLRHGEYHDQALWTILADEWRERAARRRLARESTNINGGHGCPRLRLRSSARADRAGAAAPSAAAARLLHLDRASGAIVHTHVSARCPTSCAPGDLLVVNNTRVFPGAAARPPRSERRRRRVPAGPSIGRSDRGPTRRQTPDPTAELWEALVHPGQKLKPGARVVFEGVAHRSTARSSSAASSAGASSACGPTTGRRRRGGGRDRPHAAAAVHQARRSRRRSRALSDRLRAARAARSPRRPPACTSRPQLTAALARARRRDRRDHAARRLRHVSADPRRPRRGPSPRSRSATRSAPTPPPPINARAAPRAAASSPSARRRRARSRRSARAHDGAIVAGPRRRPICSSIPAFEFRIVGGLLTNFHLPQSSLLMLVSAFAGRERVRAAYRCGDRASATGSTATATRC